MLTVSIYSPRTEDLGGIAGALGKSLPVAIRFLMRVEHQRVLAVGVSRWRTSSWEEMRKGCSAPGSK